MLARSPATERRALAPPCQRRIRLDRFHVGVSHDYPELADLGFSGSKCVVCGRILCRRLPEDNELATGLSKFALQLNLARFWSIIIRLPSVCEYTYITWFVQTFDGA